eukprot:2012672-Karenia_brevis.AAC.1
MKDFNSQESDTHRLVATASHTSPILSDGKGFTDFNSQDIVNTDMGIGPTHGGAVISFNAAISNSNDS